MMQRLYLAWLRTQEPASFEEAVEAIRWFASDVRRETDNALVRGFAAWLRGPFAKTLDAHPFSLFLLAREEREKELRLDAIQEEVLRDALREALLASDAHRLSREAGEFVREAAGASPVLVQLPMEANAGTKAGMRAHWAEKRPDAFVIWRIERPILGGLRLFSEGRLIDKSWRGAVKQLLNV